MYSIIIGSLILSLLHATIPNHWLPVIAVGRKEHWSVGEVTRITFVAAVAHGISTVVIGIGLAFVGARIASNITSFTHYVAPVILVSLGLLFIYRHHNHKHFHMREDLKKKTSKKTIVIALVLAMFLSPCMEIEAYFLLAGAQAAWLLGFIAVLYLVITTTGMVLLVRLAYLGLLKLNWHRMEHNAGIITGITLVATGLLAFFIQ